jgi:hypothetical protein
LNVLIPDHYALVWNPAHNKLKNRWFADTTTMFGEDSVPIIDRQQTQQVNSLTSIQHFNQPLIDMVLEKRRKHVTSHNGHHGLKVLLNTLTSNDHQFNFTQFILSIGFSGRMQLMSLIRKEIRNLDTTKKKNVQLSNISEIDYQPIAGGLLELFGLIQSQPLPTKKKNELAGLVSTTGQGYPKVLDNEPTFQTDDMECNNNMFEDDFGFGIQQPHYQAEDQHYMPQLCVEFFNSILKNKLVTHVRQNWFAFPMYNPDTGAPLKGRPILLFISDDYNWQNPCDCKLEHEAKTYHNHDQSGFEKNQCWHSWIIKHPTSRQSLLQLKLPDVVNEKCYLKLLNGRPSEHLCFVYAFVACTDDAILSVTSGKVRCSVCHNGARQVQGENDSCVHGEMLWNHLKPKSNCDFQCVIEDDDIQLIKSVYDSICVDSDVSFDTKNKRWIYPSRSYEIEEKLLLMFNKPIDIPPSEIDDKSLQGKCKLSRDNIENYGFPVSDQGRLEMIPDIIAQETPLYKTCNCVYEVLILCFYCCYFFIIFCIL